MVEANHTSNLPQPLPPPPPAPPLPPSRSSVLQRFIAPLTFSRPTKSLDTRGAQAGSASPKDVVHRDQPYHPPPPKTALFRTELSIAAIDINQDKTHAVLAGRDILKTVRVQNTTVLEDLDVRGLVNNHISTQQLKPEDVRKRREYLPAKDVRWSHNTYSHVVATAAQSGRIALYDVSTLGRSRVELAWLYQHTGEVNKIDFDPFSGYMLLSGSQDKFCRSWDIRDPRKPASLFQYHIRAPVRDVRWAPTDAWVFALCTEGGVVQKWDVRNTQQPQMSISAHEKSCYTIAWHPDGKHLASGGFDKHLRVWDLSGENRRQKPVIQLRGPHGIMNLAWRPPCWSAEFARAGNWQSTQITTSYTEDDHRIHIWDLRRPLIPYRELNQYDARPRDLLWASKDLLWTAGGNSRSGLFAQNDVRHASDIEDTLPPGAVTWSGDRSFYAVVEDRSARQSEAIFDPAAIFLNVPQDRLSGAEDGVTSRSQTDDEGSDVAMSEYSRRQSKAGSTRSVKSQVNTPPYHEDEPHILALDRAVAGRRDLFVNGQIGATSSLQGIHSPAYFTNFISLHYAKAMTATERAEAPDRLLHNLENAFLHNARVCEVVSMHRTAQTWRILAFALIPELKNWATKNKATRIQQQSEAQLKEEEGKERQRVQLQTVLSPLARGVTGSKSPSKPEKLMNNLLRGVAEAERASNDTTSTSNVTTPLARPLPSSSVPFKRDGSTWFTLDDAIEPIQPLPPSLANAHSTAAAASRILLDNTSKPSSSPLSLLEDSRSPSGKATDQKRTATDAVIVPTESKPHSGSPTFGQNMSSNRLRSPLANITQEERRAALRDYKATSRQLFTLDPRPPDARAGRETRHDSSESFSMFSASTSSSAKTRSVGYSLDGTKQSSVDRKDFEDWDDIHDDDYYDSLPKFVGGGSNSSRSCTTNSKGYGTSQTVDFAMDDSPQMPSDQDVPLAPQLSVPKGLQATQNVTSSDMLHQKERLSMIANDQSTAIHDGHKEDPEYTRSLSQRFHHHNPFANDHSRPSQVKEIGKKSVPPRLGVDDTISYHISDFSPIDITLYRPIQPFALSAWSIVCEAVAQDVEYGLNAAQFSVHLLSYIYPFYFNHSRGTQRLSADLQNSSSHTLADKLMHPSFSTRIVEGILVSHLEHLQRLQLHLAAAQIRKFCVEQMGYVNIGDTSLSSQCSKEAGDTIRIDQRALKTICAECKSSIFSEAVACKYCARRQGLCPICETLGPVDKDNQAGLSKLFTYCQTCGHSAHASCMATWLSIPDSQGECPTPFCGCDCGPGLVRQERITRQVNAREEDAELRASNTNTLKRDPMKVSPSPAADKARDNLRKKSFPNERDTQSGDEHKGNAGSAWSKRNSRLSNSRVLERSNSGGASSNHRSGSFNRRVRVVEPDK